jgi:hypothetical protein
VRKFFLSLFYLLFINSVFSQKEPSSPFSLSPTLVKGIVGGDRIKTAGAWLKGVCWRKWGPKEVCAVVHIGMAARQSGLLDALEVPGIESSMDGALAHLKEIEGSATLEAREEKRKGLPYRGSFFMTRVMFANRQLREIQYAQGLAANQKRVANTQRVGVISLDLVEAIGKGSSVLFGEVLQRFRSAEEAQCFLGSREEEFKGYIDSTRKNLEDSLDWRINCGTIRANPKALKALQKRGIEYSVIYSEGADEIWLHDRTNYSVANHPPEPFTTGNRQEQALARYYQRMQGGKNSYYNGSPIRRGCLPSEIATVQKKLAGLDGIETMWNNLKSTNLLDPSKAAEEALSF